MAVYVVTGKLGTGKSLSCIKQIESYLNCGRPVATNIDLNLRSLVGRNNKSARVMRVPDKPTIQDLDVIGNANPSYDESQNGALVLDELGTWLNSRTWNDKSRKPFIDWLLHARKLGWDVFLIVQHISIIDAQVREALAEHIVTCRRLDRMKIPYITSIFKLFKVDVRLPRIHVAVVKLYDMDMKVDTWWYRGDELFDAYDTKQIFTESDDGTYSLLPPYLSYGRYNPLTIKERVFAIAYTIRENALSIAICLFMSAFLVDHYASAFDENPLLSEQDQPFIEFSGESSNSISVVGEGSRPPIYPYRVVGSTGVGDYLIEYSDKSQYWASDLVADYHSIEVIDDCTILVSGTEVTCHGNG